MVILLVGLKPHRTLWTTSARPGESLLYYLLLNGCPAVVLPLLPGSPLLAWSSLTLEQLQKMSVGTPEFRGVVDVLFEYVMLCVDLSRVSLRPTINGVQTYVDNADTDEVEIQKTAIRNALERLVEGAVRSKSKQVLKEIDIDRAGIVFFRIP